MWDTQPTGADAGDVLVFVLLSSAIFLFSCAAHKKWHSGQNKSLQSISRECRRGVGGCHTGQPKDPDKGGGEGRGGEGGGVQKLRYRLRSCGCVAQPIKNGIAQSKVVPKASLGSAAGVWGMP